MDVSKLDCTQPDYQSNYASAINFLNDRLDSTALKNEFVKYAASIGREEDANRIPKNKIDTEGKIAYCLNRGAKLEDRSVQRIINLLDSIEVKTASVSELGDLPETARSKSLFVYSTCYALIDNAMLQAVNGKIDIKTIGEETRTIIRRHANSKDKVAKQLEKHYRDMFDEAQNDKSVKDWIKPLTLVIDVLQLMANSGKIKTKKSKPGAAIDRKGEKAASKVTYNPADTNLGINSAHPQSIVGSTAVVVFNTKNRHCDMYVAKAGEKLSIQGAKIINFDEKASVGKTLRNPEESLPHWSKAGNIRRLEVLMAGVNGKGWELTGKLNRNTLILKVLQ